MAHLGVNGELEGSSMHRPPFFKGNDYPFWKNRMMNFMKSYDMGVWRVIEKGPYRVTKRVMELEIEKEVDKDFDELTTDEQKKISYNLKALNCLQCALCREEYDYTCMCTSAQEIWRKLELKYEGTSQVKDSKLNMLNTKYELFKMHDGESVRDMVSRLTLITNDLSSLGKIVSNVEKVQKILRSLPKSWNTKTTAIKEAKDLRTLDLEELVGSLMTYEMEMKEDVIEEAPKSKSIALAMDSESDSSDDDDMAMLVKNFKKYMMKKRRGSFKKKD